MASWIYEGLFDVLPEEGGDLLTEFWKKEDTSIRIGSMGYRTRTIKAGTRLEAEIYRYGRNRTLHCTAICNQQIHCAQRCDKATAQRGPRPV